MRSEWEQRPVRQVSAVHRPVKFARPPPQLQTVSWVDASAAPTGTSGPTVTSSRVLRRRCSDSGYFCAFLEERAARELYPSIDHATAGQAPPNGRAVRVPGGYRVTGRWGFASGCTHADVMVGGCLMLESGGASPGELIFILAPSASFEIEDTWYPNGLAGSGSHHYKTRDLFVPGRHAFTLAGPARIDGPLYADAGSATVFIPMAGTPLGLMRRAIDVALELAGEKVIALPPPPTSMRHLPRVKFALARAQMLCGAARAAVYESVNRYWAELLRDGHGSLQTRRDMGLARVHAHRTAREVAQLMFDTVGAPAVYESSPLGALLRDAIVINQHLGFNDGVIERLGEAERPAFPNSTTMSFTSGGLTPCHSRARERKTKKCGTNTLVRHHYSSRDESAHPPANKALYAQQTGQERPSECTIRGGPRQAQMMPMRSEHPESTTCQC